MAGYFDVGQPNLANAQILGKRYFGSVDEAGARKVAHEFAADILAHWGGTSLFGTQIYFVSDRTGHKEVWSMDPDGSNQKQLTSFKSISIMPAVSPDGTKLAFTSYARGNPAIFILSTETGRRLPFYNQVASLNAHARLHAGWEADCFMLPSASGYAQIYVANLDGSNLRRISSSRAIEVEPKVNPKTGNDYCVCFRPFRSPADFHHEFRRDRALSGSPTGRVRLPIRPGIPMAM